MAVFTSVIYRDSESPAEPVEVTYEIRDFGVMMWSNERMMPVILSIRTVETQENIAVDQLAPWICGTLIHEAWEHYHGECARARELWRGSWDGMGTLTT